MNLRSTSVVEQSDCNDLLGIEQENGEGNYRGV